MSTFSQPSTVIVNGSYQNPLESDRQSKRRNSSTNRGSPPAGFNGTPHPRSNYAVNQNGAWEGPVDENLSQMHTQLSSMYRRLLHVRHDRQRNYDKKLNWTSEASQKEKVVREAQQAFEEALSQRAVCETEDQRLKSSEQNLQQDLDSLARSLFPYLNFE